MTTAREMAKDIDKVATWHNNAQWNVYILDARVSWGKIQYKLIPVSGEGTFWVDEGSVSSIRENV
jgi:hypothetical protein